MKGAKIKRMARRRTYRNRNHLHEVNDANALSIDIITYHFSGRGVITRLIHILQTDVLVSLATQYNTSRAPKQDFRENIFKNVVLDGSSPEHSIARTTTKASEFRRMNCSRRKWQVYWNIFKECKSKERECNGFFRICGNADNIRL